jgi:transcriptional regulator with XRE-family HTH domain
MAKSLRSPRHRRLLKQLIALRRSAGFTQVELALRIGKPQSFVAKYEGGERRLDVIEFLSITAALGADPCAVLRRVI